MVICMYTQITYRSSGLNWEQVVVQVLDLGSQDLIFNNALKIYRYLGEFAGFSDNS